MAKNGEQPPKAHPPPAPNTFTNRLSKSFGIEPPPARPPMTRDAQDFPDIKHQDSAVKNKAQFSQEKVKYVENILKNTWPIRFLLHATGRFPFSITNSSDGTLMYQSTLWYPQGMWFCVTSILAIYFLCIAIVNLTDLMLNLHFGNGAKHKGTSCARERMYEVSVVDRHIVTFTCVFAALCHVTIVSVHLFLKRKYIAKYFSFWTQVAKIVHVDVTADTLIYSYVMVTMYLVVMACFIAMAAIRLSASPSGAPNLLSVLTFRMYIPCLLAPVNTTKSNYTLTNKARILEGSCGVLLVFFFLASKSLMLLFIQCCRMLTTTLTVWNSRFQTALNIKASDGEQNIRVSYQILFDDHCILSSLIDGTDKCFGSMVESYIAVQIITVIMESYFVYQTANLGGQLSQKSWGGPSIVGTFKDPKPPFYQRPNDWLAGTVMLLIDILILILILKEAGKVYLVAGEGLEVIRRKTTMSRKSDQELWFTLSMFSSYTYSELALRGSGFFIFNNDFIITVLSIIMSCVVAVVQFAPPMSPDLRNATYNYERLTDKAKWDDIQKFLSLIEHKKIN